MNRGHKCREFVTAQLTLNRGTPLAGIASKFTVGDKLPKVPYQTFIDRYQDSCFYHQFGITFTIPIVYLSHQIWDERFDFDVDDEGDLWENREKWARWVNIGLFVFMLGVFTWRNLAFMAEIQRHWHEVSVWKTLGGMDSLERYPNPNTAVRLFDAAFTTTATALGLTHLIYLSCNSSTKYLKSCTGTSATRAGIRLRRAGRSGGTMAEARTL